MSQAELSVSVVISTRNEEAVIERLLQSIRAQTYAPLEVILVDNHSTDRTCEIAKPYVDKLLLHGPERSAQRNRGVAEARGDYVLILDADMELTETVIEEAVSYLVQDPSLKALFIPELSYGDNYWARCKALERNCYVDDVSMMAARLFDRQTFEAVGGYDEALTGPEDWDLSQRVGKIGSVTRIKSTIYHNEGTMTLLGQMRKKYYYAHSFRRYRDKHPRLAWRQANLAFRPAFLRHWRSLVASLHLTLGMMLLRLCETAAGIAGVWAGSHTQKNDLL